jgi:predicted RNase H-like nuclease
MIAGVDGCKGGWLYVVLDAATHELVGAGVLPQFRAVIRLTPTPEIVAVDIPIGLTDRGPRECDKESRQRLHKPRSNSVFPAPVRAALRYSNDFSLASQISEQQDGRKLNRQVFHLLVKIKEVDDFLREDVSRQIWVREVHPEMSFAAWNNGKPMTHRKKSRAGREERERLVTNSYGTAYEDALRHLKPATFAKDDLLDAFAALWTAGRIWQRCAAVIPVPEREERDACGLRMAIWY